MKNGSAPIRDTEIQASDTTTKPSRAYSVVLRGLRSRSARLIRAINPIVTRKPSTEARSPSARLMKSAGTINAATMRRIMEIRRAIMR
jgi:hypothetical protein